MQAIIHFRWIIFFGEALIFSLWCAAYTLCSYRDLKGFVELFVGLLRLFFGVFFRHHASILTHYCCCIPITQQGNQTL
jgi:hypothetical protein